MSTDIKGLISYIGYLKTQYGNANIYWNQLIFETMIVSLLDIFKRFSLTHTPRSHKNILWADENRGPLHPESREDSNLFYLKNP